MVNYRTIVQALVDSGVTEILAINVVGGIGHEAGDLVVVDDFIDYTKQRPVTFFDGSTPEGVVHVDMGDPYDARLRETWLAAAQSLGVDVTPTGIYGAFEGPRFETKAEIRMARSAGVTVVGMTGVPEVVLVAVVARGAETVTAILGRAAALLAEKA
jgi:5'-methylthioadenosine phosphorylase